MASLPFPQEPETFADDERISFSKESKTYILEDGDGNEWEWLEGPKKWSKTVRISRLSVYVDDGLWLAPPQIAT